MKVADLLQKRPHAVLGAADALVSHEAQEDVAALRVAVLVDGHVCALAVVTATGSARESGFSLNAQTTATAAVVAAGLALEKFAPFARHAGRDAFPVFQSSSLWQR